MDAEDRKLLIDIHGKVSGIEPAIRANAEALKSIDERQRNSEIVTAQHGVKIDRIESDLDGLGRKVRFQAERRLQQPREDHSGKWITFLEFLAVLPAYWQALIVVGSLAVTLLALGLRAHGIHVP